MQINIDVIQVNFGWWEVLLEVVCELVDSILVVGLLNLIIVDWDYILIVGLYWLEVVKLFGWLEIECYISILEGLQVEFVEIDENFVCIDLEMVEFGKLLMWWKEIYEILYLEIRCGVLQVNVMNCVQGNNVSECGVFMLKFFIWDIVKKLGIFVCLVEENIQIVRDIILKVQEVIQGFDCKIKKKDLLKLFCMELEQQEYVVVQLVVGKIKFVDEF